MDPRKTASAASAASAPSTDARPHPTRLQSPRWRMLLENMERSRKWMELAEQKSRAGQRKEEKLRLGLSEEEEILFMAERSRLANWPVASSSLVLLVSSALIPEGGGASFTCLVLGLIGLAFLSAVKGRTKLYLTNFRVLLRRSPISRKKARWSQVSYADVRKLSLQKGFLSGTLSVGGGRESAGVKGLARADLETAVEILREKLPPKLFHSS